VQLSLYAIAATEIPEPPFHKKPEDVLLTFYFFDTQQRVSTTRTREQLVAEKERIIEIAQQIEQSDLRCSGSEFCASCEYKMFCSVA